MCAKSMSSLSAVLLHRREVLPHMCIMLLSLFFFVFLLLVGRSGGFRARAHHACCWRTAKAGRPLIQCAFCLAAWTQELAASYRLDLVLFLAPQE